MQPLRRCTLDTSTRRTPFRRGALRDLQGFEAIVDLAVAELTPSEAEVRRAAEFSLGLKNEEFNEDYAQHYSEDDSGWTAGEFLSSYIDKVRATSG